MIPNFSPPYEDELIEGWFIRAAALNGMTPGIFIKTYLDVTDNQKIYRESDYSFQHTAGFYRLKRVEPRLPEMNILLKHNTVMPILAPFYSSSWQAGKIWGYLYNRNGRLNIPRYVMQHSMKYCPECVDEDRVNGKIPYYRVWHQFSSVCPVHGCRLLTCQNSALQDEHDEKVQIAASPRSSYELDRIYADFARNIYQRCPDLNAKEIVRFREGMQMVLGLNNVETTRYLNDRGWNFTSCTKTAMSDKSIAGIKEMNYLIGLTEDYSLFEKLIAQRQRNFEDRYLEKIQRLEERGFKSLERDWIIVRLKCGECGKEFWSHPDAVLLGRTCPRCEADYSSREILENQIKLVPGYYMTERFDEYNTKVVHERCGEISGNALNLIWNDKRCNCQNRHFTKIQAGSIQLQDIKGYTIIRDIAERSSVLVMHNICKTTFEYSWKSRNKLECPLCAADIKEESLIPYLEEEYTLLSTDYMKRDSIYKATVRHKHCGTIYQVMPSHFEASYGRCPLCTRHVSLKCVVRLMDKYFDKNWDELILHSVNKRESVLEIHFEQYGVKYFRQRQLIHALTSKDEPELFVRKTRMEPFKSSRLLVMEKAGDCEKNGFQLTKSLAKSATGQSSSGIEGVLNWLVKNGYLERTETSYRVADYYRKYFVEAEKSE